MGMRRRREGVGVVDVRVVKPDVALGLAGRSCAHGAGIVGGGGGSSGDGDDEDGGGRGWMSLGEKEESVGWDRVAVYMGSLGRLRSGQGNNEKTITDRSRQRLTETPTARKRDESGRRFHHPIIPVQCNQIRSPAKLRMATSSEAHPRDQRFPGNYFTFPHLAPSNLRFPPNALAFSITTPTAAGDGPLKHAAVGPVERGIRHKTPIADAASARRCCIDGRERGWRGEQHGGRLRSSSHPDPSRSASLIVSAGKARPLCCANGAAVGGTGAKKI